MSIFDKPVSITEIIREILASNTLYYSALQSGIANYAALAKKVKPEIEKRTAHDVDVGAIVAGLKRIANNIREHEEEQNRLDDLAYFEQIADDNLNAITSNTKSSIKISLIGNIVNLELKDEIAYDQLSNVLSDIFCRETEYSLFQTCRRLSLFIENEEFSNTRRPGSAKYLKKIRKGLSKITITIPSDNEFNITNHQEADLEKNSFRILSFIVRLLYNYQLPLHDAFITSNKVVLILSDKDAAKTYEILRTKMSGQ